MTIFNINKNKIIILVVVRSPTVSISQNLFQTFLNKNICLRSLITSLYLSIIIIIIIIIFLL